VLERILKPAAGIQLGSYVEAKGKALFHLMKEKGIEGIIAKRKDSIYRPGKRTSDWLKIKARLQREFVVGGFTAPKGSRKHLGAVVLGAYTNGELRHYGYALDGLHVVMMDAANRSNKSSVVQWKRFKETRLVKVRLLLPRKVGTVKPTHSLSSQDSKSITSKGSGVAIPS
jgi:ATP-dependent DNA ligase